MSFLQLLLYPFLSKRYEQAKPDKSEDSPQCVKGSLRRFRWPFPSLFQVQQGLGHLPHLPPKGSQLLGLVLHQVQEAGAIRSLALQVLQQEPHPFAQAAHLEGLVLEVGAGQSRLRRLGTRGVYHPATALH